MREWLKTPAILLFLCSCALGGQPATAPASAAPKLVIQQGARVAIVGDSITEQKIYSEFMEEYLSACTPQLKVHCIQLGWGGETAPGFLARMDRDLMWFKPNVVTTCYGMNDGRYRAFEAATGATYAAAMTTIVDRLKQAGATVIVGSPGAVDTKSYTKGKGPDAAKIYNETLARLGQIDQKLAGQEGMPFADLHDTMMIAMASAKAAYGDSFEVCGRDGVHPGPDGHLVMAYVMLEAMGLDGDIATIDVDMKGGATASDGHRILSAADGKIEIESTRYPFCFSGDEKSSSSARSMLPFLPFNKDLNRFVLRVKNLDADKAKVMWGQNTKTFTREELDKGVNLADAFPTNPFSIPFSKVEAAVAAKQEFETSLIKGTLLQLHTIGASLGDDKDADAAVSLLRDKLLAKQQAFQAGVNAAVAPVKHLLWISPGN